MSTGLVAITVAIILLALFVIIMILLGANDE